MAYMIQLTAMADTTNSPKQNAPKWIILRGSARWVIPITMDANSEYNSTAEKCDIYRSAFRPFARDCASTAAITFSRPATTMNLEP